MRKIVIILILSIFIGSCGNQNNCNEYCTDVIATNYSECGSCRYSNTTFYLREPDLIQITVDSTITELDSLGQPVQHDTSFTRMVPDTVNYYIVNTQDLPLTFRIDSLSFTLNELFNIPINSCGNNISNTAGYNFSAGQLKSWVAISADSNKVFTGSISPLPNQDCFVIEINKKQ